MQPEALTCCGGIKKVFDPDNILNPGKNMGGEKLKNSPGSLPGKPREINLDDANKCMKCGFCSTKVAPFYKVDPYRESRLPAAGTCS